MELSFFFVSTKKENHINHIPTHIHIHSQFIRTITLNQEKFPLGHGINSLNVFECNLLCTCQEQQQQHRNEDKNKIDESHLGERTFILHGNEKKLILKAPTVYVLPSIVHGKEMKMLKMNAIMARFLYFQFQNTYTHRIPFVVCLSLFFLRCHNHLYIIWSKCIVNKKH